MIKELKTPHYKYVAKDLGDWYGFYPTVTQLKKFLVGEPEMKEMIRTQPYLRYGLDTSEREEIAQIFARKLTGKSWPTGATKKREAKKFFKEFVRKAKKAGIETDLEAMYE